MRIISGILGGRQLRSIPGEKTRPAMAKAREALFSMLEARGINWPGTRVLDLYAGTGSLAFECLSRGASAAVLVDNAESVCRCIRSNIDALAVYDRARLVCGDVLKFLRRQPPSPFDLVFIDPPYRRNCLNPCLIAITERPWLAPQCFVSVEVEITAQISLPPGLQLLTQRHLGQTSLNLYTYSGCQDENSHVPGDI